MDVCIKHSILFSTLSCFFFFFNTSQKALVWDTFSQGLLPGICIVNDMASMVVTDSSSVESARNPRRLEINCVVCFNI